MNDDEEVEGDEEPAQGREEAMQDDGDVEVAGVLGEAHVSDDVQASEDWRFSKAMAMANKARKATFSSYYAAKASQVEAESTMVTAHHEDVEQWRPIQPKSEIVEGETRYAVNLVKHLGGDVRRYRQQRADDARRIVSEVYSRLRVAAMAIKCSLAKEYFLGSLWTSPLSRKMVIRGTSAKKAIVVRRVNC